MNEETIEAVLHEWSTQQNRMAFVSYIPSDCRIVITIGGRLEHVAMEDDGRIRFVVNGNMNAMTFEADVVEKLQQGFVDDNERHPALYITLKRAQRPEMV